MFQKGQQKRITLAPLIVLTFDRYLSPAVLGSVWLPGWCRGDIALLCDLENHLGRGTGRGGDGRSPSSLTRDNDDDEGTEQLLGAHSDDSGA